MTGSDGKTTTTTIISEFLKAAGFNVHLEVISASRFFLRLKA